jgi:hypothetical protein
MKRLSAREQKRKDDLAKAAESIRNMNRMRDVEVRPSRLPADDDYEGANGDAMREEALEMMNRGNLAAEVRHPSIGKGGGMAGRASGGSNTPGEYDDDERLARMRRRIGGLRDRNGKIRKGYMVR